MSPGSVTEKLYFYLAEYHPQDRTSAGGGVKAEGEDIDVLEMTLDDALRGIENGQIVDGKTIMLLYHGPQRHFIISPLARYLPRRRYLPVLFLLNTSTWRCENGRLGSSLYLQYSAERTRPAAELLARVPLADITSGVDLGCGRATAPRC